MNNKLITAVLTLSLLSPVAISQASGADAPVLAILDTAIDTSVPALSNKVVGEVCILEWALCPNGTNFQEGPGSASMPSDLITKNGFDHGTFMATTAVQSNPNLKILFVKIIGNTSAGLRKPTGESTISAALLWIKENAAKYNVKAVSLSQGSSGLLGKAGTQYCPTFPTTISAVKSLSAMSIPVFSAVGNARDYSRIDWPSCIPEVIAVGAVDQIGEITSYSNNDAALTDFFALGNLPAVGPGNVTKNIAGTSSATQVSAATYLKLMESFGQSGEQLINTMKANASSTTGRQGTFKKRITLFNTAAPTTTVVPQTNTAASDAAAKLAAEKAAKAAALKLEVDAGIAAAEKQYAIDLKAAQDKLAAAKAAWMAKLNG
jgi:hypothetical protein